MDLQTALICALFAVTSSILLYLISISFVKENSFEEAKANRRKLMKQYFDETRITNEKAKEKKSKKNKKVKEKYPESDKIMKKGKNKSSEDSQTTDDSDTKVKPVMENKVVSDEKFEKIDVIPSKPEKKETKKLKISATNTIGKSDLGKKLLKEESTKAHTEEVVENSKIVAVQANMTPSDQQKLNNGHIDEISNAKQTSEMVNESTGKDVTSKESQNKVLPVQNAKPGKKKRDITSLYQLGNEKDAVNMNLLMSLIQKAELSKSEIQLLIDALLNMQQQESSEWLKGRQDPIVKMKKQLAEKEKALIDEKEASSGLQAKLKELRAELNSDKTALRHLEESVLSKQNEFKVLSTKFQQVTEENQSLLLKTQQLQKQLNEELIMVSKMKEEQLQQQHHEATLALQSHVNKLVAENTRLQEAIQDKEEYNNELLHKLQTYRFEATSLENKITKDHQAQIENLNSVIQSLNNEKQTLLERNNHLSEVTASLQEHLIDANDSAAKENRENGEINYAHQQQEHEEFQAVLEEKETLLSQLNCELNQKDQQIEKLNSDIIICKNEANKKQTVLDNTTAELCSIRSQHVSLTALLSEKENQIVSLQTEMGAKTEEINNLKKDIDTYKQRNNDLRNRNWKIMEALKTTEKELAQSQLKESSSTVEIHNEGLQQLKENVAQLFQRIFPNISIEDNKDEHVWLKNMEEAALTAKNSISSNHNSVSELEFQNRQLQTMVSRYKEIINDTEGMLNSLQAHVEVEETKWGEKIQSLQAELDTLRGPKHSKSTESYRSNGVSSATDNE